MKRSSLLGILGLFSVIVCTAAPAAAQGAEEWSFFGGLQVGYRAVDLDGSEDKYLQHLGLDDGPRLFNLNFELTPTDEMRGLFDRIELDMTNLGGDPFETIRFSVQKFGHYTLRYDRRKSSYIYGDTDPNLSDVLDLHRFDFDRVRDTVDFTLQLSSSAQLDLGFDRSTKKGQSTTTLDIQRDVFELERPVDESLSDYHLAFSYEWSRVSLVFNSRMREFDNAIETFLPGFSEGENPDNETVLASYFLHQPYDLRSVTPSIRLVARPTDRLNIKLYAAVEDLSMELELAEDGVGTTWQGEPYVSSATGDGRVDRLSTIYDLELDYRFLDWFGAFIGFQHRDLEQDGDLAFGDEEGFGAWRMDTSSGHIGLQFDIGTSVTATGGVRAERRDVDWGWSQVDSAKHENRATDHTGTFVTLGWRPTTALRFSARLDNSAYDDPFTPSSASDRLSYRLSGAWSGGRGFSISGVVRGQDLTNDTSGWDLSSRAANLRLGYRLPGLSLSAGYTILDVDRSIDQTVTTLPGFGGGQTLFFPIAYHANSDFFDARVVWAAATRLKIGGEVRWYDNDGTFATSTRDLRGFFEIGFGRGYVAHLGYRDRDYSEADRGWSDYRARITEVSVGYRW